MTRDAVFELRDYLLHPGQRDVLIDLFEDRFIETQEAAGARIRALFRDIDRPDHFVWIRSFADMDARLRALTDFYSGPVWRAHRDAANATMISSDDVHLLRPCAQALPEALPAASSQAPAAGALCVVDVLPDLAEQALLAALDGRRDVLAAFRTEPSANNFPPLPVHTGKAAVVIRTVPAWGWPGRLEGLPAPLHTLRLRPTRRSPLQLAAKEQSPRDFDFLAGAWRVRNCRLRTRGAGADDWEEFPATNRFWTLLDGVANVDEFDCPAKGFKGMTIRTLDRLTGVWSIWWINSAQGTPTPPVRGGFVGDAGEFLGEDIDGARPVLCRFRWTRDPLAPRWEQAFSYDAGGTWETNWVMEFSRA